MARREKVGCVADLNGPCADLGSRRFTRFLLFFSRESRVHPDDLHCIEMPTRIEEFWKNRFGALESELEFQGGHIRPASWGYAGDSFIATAHSDRN
jgi:hypothetical protein